MRRNNNMKKKFLYFMKEKSIPILNYDFLRIYVYIIGYYSFNKSKILNKSKMYILFFGYRLVCSNEQ